MKQLSQVRCTYWIQSSTSHQKVVDIIHVAILDGIQLGELRLIRYGLDGFCCAGYVLGLKACIAIWIQIRCEYILWILLHHPFRLHIDAGLPVKGTIFLHYFVYQVSCPGQLERLIISAASCSVFCAQLMGVEEDLRLILLRDLI